MRRIVSVLLITLISFALTACGSNSAVSETASSDTSEETSSSSSESSSETSEESSEATESGEVTTAESSAEEATENTGSTLVVYFSATGTTEALAEYAADSIGAELYEIEPAEPYTDADLDYGNDNSRSTQEMNDPSARPEISGSIEDIAQYDTIFIGYPIWWGEAPRILSTFVESYDLSGKTIVPFCTSSSSGIGSSATKLAELTSGAEWLEGERFGSGTSRDEIVSWINGLGLGITAE